MTGNSLTVRSFNAIPALSFAKDSEVRKWKFGGWGVGRAYRGQVDAVADVLEDHVEGLEAEDHAFLGGFTGNGAHVARGAAVASPAATAGHAGAGGGSPIPGLPVTGLLAQLLSLTQGRGLSLY